MTPQAEDFLAECESIYALLKGRRDDVFAVPTLFKSWTIGDGQSDADIFKAWADSFPDIAARFRAADPLARVRWVGPDMSVASCIIARQMEHWAHAQAIFDVLGEDRVNTDRLKNVAQRKPACHFQARLRGALWASCNYRTA